jgi:hypothetical protein
MKQKIYRHSQLNFLKPFELDTVTLELDKNAAGDSLNEQLVIGDIVSESYLKRNISEPYTKLHSISNSKIQTITLFVEHETDIETVIAPISGAAKNK